MDKYFAAGPLVKLKIVVAFNIDYFGNEKGFESGLRKKE